MPTTLRPADPRPADPRPAYARRDVLLDALVLFLIGLVTGCADAPAATPPSDGRPSRAALTEPAAPRPVDATRRRLEEAADGLLYTSESDYPFEYVRLAGNAEPPLTAAAFRAAASVPSDSVLEERSLDEFFARHIEHVDPNDSAAAALVPRYERLKRTIRTSVRDARVFRVGTIAIRCYVVGVDAWGNVVGLATTAIET